jgi:hypothetical protein
MLPCYDAPRRARVRIACTARVRRGDGEARGAQALMHRGARAGLGKERVSGGVWPRSAVASGADAEAARARGRDDAAQSAADTNLFC